MVKALQELKSKGWLIAIWTCREDSKDLREHLKTVGVPFDYVNENPHGPPSSSPKIFGDVYLDDRAVRFDGSTEGLVQKIEEARVPWEEKSKEATIGVGALLSMRDELGKMATASRVAGFMQARRGSTPIRISTLLKRDAEREYGHGIYRTPGVLKKASLSEKKEQALEAFAAARPYVASTVKGAIPGMFLGGILGASKGKHGYGLAKGFAAIGGAAGLADRSIHEWAKKHKRKDVAKKIISATRVGN